MASKRVHEIAKEQGLSSADVLTSLRAAGLDVTAAASVVDEAEALRALKANGSGASARKPAARAATGSTPSGATPAPAGAQRPAHPATAPAPPATGGTSRIFEPDGPPLKLPTRRQEEGLPPRPPLPQRPSESAAARQRAAAAATPPAPKAEPQPPAPAAEAPTAEASAPTPTAPEAAPQRAAEAAAPASGSTASAAPAPADAPAASTPPADAPEAATATPEASAGSAPSASAPADERPAPGTGPKIIARPEPEQKTRPTRDESKTQPSRPTRGGVRNEGGPGGGRRRVVIDSQASRRGPGGPGGPGGPPGGGPPQRRGRGRGRRRRDVLAEVAAPLDEGATSRTDTIKVQSGSTVKDVGEYLGVPVPELIKRLMLMGEMVTLTQTLSDEAIVTLAEELEKPIEIVHAGDDVDAEPEFDDADEDLVERPPVVTIMGHVDHGKTSLLDAIRTTEVVKGEAGGITQHIGAYQVHHDDRVITFLDTPGHEAFTAMRARGARVTDVAVIVVAADDGVKPQTDEAIDHARAADVPILVAVNKIDKEGADPTRVRTELTQRNLQPAEWGGDTEFVDVSAKTHEGLDSLLETILVVTELEELRSNPAAPASGVVIESKLDPGRGPVVTLLIQRGTLRVGESLVAGSHWGKVRAMVDYQGERVEQAVPGDPVEVLGFDGVPDAGDSCRVVENDRTARQLANERAVRLRNEAQARRAGRKISFDEIFQGIRQGEVKELNLVLKADVSGSLEAFEDEIAKLPQDEVQVNVIRSGVGGINESDVMLAAASDAVILGFNVRPVGDARAAADREDIEIRTYSVIYRAIDDLRAAMEGMLEPEEVEETVGQVEVRQTFRASRVGTIAGCYVTEGRVTRGARTRLVRDGTVIYDTTIESLKRFNDDTREVAAGFECGIVLANFQDVKEGDVMEVYETRTVERELS